MFQPHLWIMARNHIGAVFPRFSIQFAEDFIFLFLDNFWIYGWWEVWDLRVGGSMLLWVQVLWHIFQVLRLTFDLVLLVEEMGSKLKGPVMAEVSDRLTMSAHWIYFL